MTRYIVKEFFYGRLVKRSTVIIPKGVHPKVIQKDCPLSQFPSGSRIYYESNGQEVAVIYRTKDNVMRVRWHRL